MSEDKNYEQMEERPGLKIQGNLPIRAVGLETQRERKNYSDLPPQNYLHVWWARRPTPATRLAILSSVLPNSVDDDILLRWMGIDPDNNAPEVSISEHVRQKYEILDQRAGLVYEHYGYRKSYKNLPGGEELQKLHTKAQEQWGGELPTILDATAGGGSIPFESLRYGFPTIANELNPVASIILKAVLEQPRVDGDLSGDIEKWGEEINTRVRNELSGYFPDPDGYRSKARIWAHTVTCPDCGLEVPLTPSWWLHKESSNEGVAVEPSVENENDIVTFSIRRFSGSKPDYDPNDGSVSYGKGECLRCGVTIDGDEVKGQAQNGEMGFQLMAVEVEPLSKSKNGQQFRAPYKEEKEAIEHAKEEVQNSPELATFLDVERYIGPADRSANYGITKWRDAYTPRQFLSHYTYLQKYNEVKEDILEEYSRDEAEVILTFLAIAADKALNYNSRLSAWHITRGVILNTFERHDFSFKWNFGELNLLADDAGYDWVLDSAVEVYEELRELSGQSEAPVDVLQGDASSLPLEESEVEAVVLDPPYYDNVMYAELSDYFYVWLGEYLGDIYPEFFTHQLTDKQSEAVANVAEFDDVAGDGQSKSELAQSDYENKMTRIFAEMHRILDEDGVFTLMFTHKKTEAWDTLTTALIEAGFVVTSTHPVSTESKFSLHQSGKNSAESTIILSSEKRQNQDEEFTLWSDIQRDTRKVARERAKELDQGDIEFTKVDIILASFGPTLQVFTESYPVVDDEGEEVIPQIALDEARGAVRDYFIDHYLNEGVHDVDPKTEWYILAWLVFEAQRFPYDEARRLAIGVGEDLDVLKRTHRMWRKRSGDVVIRPHNERIQNINKKNEDRSGRLPVDPDALSFSTALDKVHGAMHVYNAKGATEAWNWMNERNCNSDPAFRATLEAILRVLPHDHDDWELARDLAAGETGDLLDLDLDADIFQNDKENNNRQGNLTDF